MMTNLCSKCKQEKPVSEFGKAKEKKNGLKSNCKECCNKTSKASFSKNKDKYYAKQKDYAVKNSKEIGSYKRDWHFKNKYNLSLEELNAMKVAQNFCCKLCGKHELETPRQSLCVDHCHKTNKVRGLLCESCNQALGLFYDNPEVIRKAAEYIE